jgi:hypothetical protein
MRSVLFILGITSVVHDFILATTTYITLATIQNMDTPDFLSKWTTIGKKHFHADEVSRREFNLGSAAHDFLFRTGMPSEFLDLNFDYLKESLETVNQKWSLENSHYDKYLAIGFNGSGDPIAINLVNQELIYLNHDNDFEEVFINSDMKRFALSVLRFQSFIEQLRKLNTDSFFETEFSDEQLEHLIQDLNVIDPKAFEIDNGHWKSTLDYYKWERDDERRTAANKM